MCPRSPSISPSHPSTFLAHLRSVRKQIKIRPGFTPQEDVSRFRGTKQTQKDINTLPKGHIIGWAPLPTSTSSGSPLSKRAKKNAKKKAKREGGEEDFINEGRFTVNQKGEEISAKEEEVPENWEDDVDGSGPQGSNSGTPYTNPSMTTTTDLEPAKEDQQVYPADVESDLSSKLDKLNVK